ncbi:MAG: ATPase [Desulfomonile tiedjei]|uniref:ATPase n=1 Tax=Desulfomonile tiedjei TaxID=2358 RepID=A0A9D6V0Y9_9BACT|nr:ATPase [Desulfomonile tiedjei]
MISGAKKQSLIALVSSPQTGLIGGFAAAILVGALLLCLPWAHYGKVGFLDALFTSTSAVCVTGLTVVDTANDYTMFGQVIIVILIQTGGLGIMTFAGLAFNILGRRMSLQSLAVLQDTFFQRDVAADFQRTFKTILALTFLIEGIGALLLWIFLLPMMDPGAALFSAVFHSVSAFCNAGFSLRSENLMGLSGSPGILIVIMSLIVLGGLGYTVLNEAWLLARGRGRSPGLYAQRRFSMHARLVLWVSSILIVGGCLAILLFGLTPGETHWGDRILHSLFQSVTARTAGFNSVDIGKLPQASLFILIVLMFIGGSPASCAGGVKTTTAVIWSARLRAALRGERDVHLLDRRLPWEQVGKADLLMGLAIFWNLIGILFLLSTEAHLAEGPLALIFEQVSAFGTVGLSAGLTPNLSAPGKLWIIATMFVGRLGPLTIAMWVVPLQKAHVRYPKGTVMIG